MTSIPNFMSRLLAAAASVLLIACADTIQKAYSGSDRSNAEIGIIECGPFAYIRALNGDNRYGSPLERSSCKIAVLPGTHSVRVQVQSLSAPPGMIAFYKRQTDVQFEVGAGKTYLVIAAPDHDGYSIKVVDKTGDEWAFHPYRASAAIK